MTIDISSWMSRYQTLRLKLITIILCGDYDPETLLLITKSYLEEMQNMKKLLNPLNESEPVTDKEAEEFVKDILLNYDVFIINGRIKFARKNSKLWYAYRIKAGANND